MYVGKFLPPLGKETSPFSYFCMLLVILVYLSFWCLICGNVGGAPLATLYTATKQGAIVTVLLRTPQEGQPGDHPTPLPPHSDTPRNVGVCQVHCRYV